MASIQFASPGTGPLASSIGWIDYGTLVIGPGTTVPGIVAAYPDGSTVTFDLSNTAISGGGIVFNAVPSPSWGGASFGRTGYNNINGNVVLYSMNTTGPASSSLTLSNIAVRDPHGNLISNYSLVGADGESTDIVERIVLQTNGPIWDMLVNLPAVSPPPLGPNISGVGTNTVTIQGGGTAGGTTGPVFISRTPNQVSATLSVLPGQLEGVVFGIVLTKITLVKDITKRVFPSDQFQLNISGSPNATNTTTGTTTGPQTSTEAVVYDIPQGNAYSFNELMYSGSYSLLNQYSQSINTVNLLGISEGGTNVSGINALGQTVTPTIGDNIIITVTNTPYPVSTKKIVDKEFANLNDIITYTVGIVNPSVNTAVNVNFVDTIPSGTTFIPGSLIIDGVPDPGSPAPPSGVTLATVLSGQLSTITFQVQVNTIPSSGLIQNSSTTNYVFSISTIPGGSFNSNRVTTKINSVVLSSLKSVDKNQSFIGDTLTYTVALKNTGTTDALSVIFKDTIPNGTEFVPNSFTINGISQVLSNPNPPGVNIGSIPVGTTTVTFSVNVVSIPNPNPIPNASNVTFNYIVDPSLGTTNSGSSNSNIVNTTINYASISNPLKLVDLSNADVGDKLTYSVILRNTGNTTAKNVVFVDTIPNGTSFIVNSVLVNGTSIPGASPLPTTGVNMGDIGPSQVATLIFNVTVSTVPSPNPMINSGTAIYKYMVDPSIGSTTTGSGVTNEVSTQVNNANLDKIIKSVDKNIAKINDVLTYTVAITNTGTTSANNVIFADTVPTDTTFVPNSLTVNGIVQPGQTPNPPGLNIGVISAGGTSTVSFSVTINTIPTPNPIQNSATAQYSYISDPTNGTTKSKSSNSNIVNTKVNDAVINSFKLVNATDIMVGNSIIYTIGLRNVGNTTANNVVFIDTIPNGTSFVDNSVTVNGVVQNGATVAPPTGITIPNLGPNQSATITFSVNAITVPTPNPTTNTGTTRFNFIVDPSLGTTGTGGSNTNQVSTFVNTNTNLNKLVDKMYATVGDTLTYTLSLENTLTIDQGNLAFIDTIPNGTTFIPNSIKINGVAQPGATITSPNGLNLGTLLSGNAVTVTFEVKVDTIPTPNPIPNTASATFSYVIDPTIGTTSRNSNISNTVSTTINFVNISNINKSVNKSFATVGDILTYNISFTNTGNTSAINTIFKDTIPSGTTFVPNSFTVNGVSIPGANPDYPSGTSIGDTPAGGTTTLTFEVNVNTIPSPNPIPNNGTLTYDYIIDDITGTTVSGSKNTNTVNTTINFANVSNPVKVVDKDFADVGTTLTYTLVLRNTGNTSANNVVLADTIPSGTTFVPNSVTINGVTIPGANPSPPLGINVGTIPAGSVFVVEFEVKVDTIPAINPIPNSATTNYSYLVDPVLNIIRTGTGITNIVNTQINNANLNNITKSVDKVFATVEDILTYTITIPNTGNTSANNVIFADTVPLGTTFVPNSFAVNGVSQPGQDPNPPGVNIGIIPAQSMSTVTFKVKVDTIPAINPIPNSATTNYSYLVDPINGIWVNEDANSNRVYTQINAGILNSSKSTNASNVIVGDTIVYTIVVNNSGNTIASNVVLIDTIPSGTAFVPNSLYVNGINIPGANPSPPAGVNLNNIGENGVSTVSFSVIATTVPSPNPTPNSASIKFNYIVDPTLMTRLPGGSNTNTVTTFINQNTNLVKSVDNGYATVGDTLTYTLSLQNTLNIDQNNLVFIDTIPNGTTFIPNSITINGVSQVGATITGPNGLSLGTLSAGSSVMVTFSALVNTIPSTNPIPDTASATFSYIVDPTLGTSFVKSNISNTVNTTINFATLGILKKQVNEVYAVPEQNLTYTITLKNTGNTTALNAIFIDTIPTGSTFIPNTFSINGVSIPGADPSPPVGVNIGTIGVGTTVTLAFKVVVNSIPPVNFITNIGTVNYDYVVNDRTGTTRNSTQNTNIVLTTTNYAYIKSPLKIEDREFADIGTTITYTIALQNTGNQTANNVIFLDTIPTGTTFIPNSVTVNGITQAGVSPNPPTGVSVGDIGAGITSTVTFKVIVNTIPAINPIPNIGNTIYSFIIDPTLGIRVKDSSRTNTVYTLVNHAELQNIKYLDKSFAQIGDTITYTIQMSNIGSTSAYNIMFVDTIPSGTSFVPNSFSIDGANITGANPSPPLGVNIGTIPSKGVSTVTFKVVVNTIPQPNPILNSATTGFKYTVDPKLGIIANANSNTNIVSTKVNNAILNGSKFTDVTDAIVGDAINYSINITNIGNTTASNILFIDTIPNGTSFIEDSVIINGAKVPGVTVAPPTGVTVPNLGVGQSASIAFSVLVNTIPSPNPILNAGRALYEFTVDPVLGTKGFGVFDTNTVPTLISEQVKPIKYVNTKYATIGDTLSYTIVWKNILSTAQSNVIFIDTIPTGTTFIPNSIRVNGLPQAGSTISPPNGLNIGTMLQGQMVTITFDVSVDTIPSENPLLNNTDVIFNYISNKVLGTVKRRSEVSNTVDTTINVAKIDNILKAVDKSIATIGDEITYTITFSNSGNVDAINLVFRDTIPTGTIFMPNSFAINDVVQPGQSPAYPNGVNIGTLAVGATMKLSFKVKVITIPLPNIVKNIGTLNYNYIVNPQTGRVKSVVINTNTVTTQIIAARICAIKCTDTCSGFVGMQITYTINLQNTGNTTAYNINLTDTIPNGTVFVENSVSINGMLLPGETVAPPQGIVIPQLGVNQAVIIKFKVLVDTIPQPNPIQNSGTVKFSYTVIQNPISTVTRSTNTNIVETCIDPCSNFTKIYEELYLKSQILDKKYIAAVNEAEQLEECSKNLEAKAQMIRAQAKMLEENVNKLNEKASNLLNLAAFYANQSVQCKRNAYDTNRKKINKGTQNCDKNDNCNK